MEGDLSASRILSPSLVESSDEDLAVLPRHTKVIVTGNNRTKSVLVGLQGVVKKAIGLGGWHWLVLKNGVEVKLQRNALSVLEAPSGNEDRGDVDCDNSSCGCLDIEDKNYSTAGFHRSTKPRARNAKSWTSSTTSMKSSNQNNYRDVQLKTVNLSKLGTAALWRYWRHFNLVGMNPKPSKEQLIHGVENHFLSQQLDEMQVIVRFIHTKRRRRAL